MNVDVSTDVVIDCPSSALSGRPLTQSADSERSCSPPDRSTQTRAGPLQHARLALQRANEAAQRMTEPVLARMLSRARSSQTAQHAMAEFDFVVVAGGSVARAFVPLTRPNHCA
jgi:hypothetical protein